MKAGCPAWLWLLLWCVGSGWWKRVRQRNRQEQMVAGVGYSWAELSLRKSLFGDGWLSSWALLHFLGSSELVGVLLVAGGWLEWEHIPHTNWKHYKLAPLHLSVLYFQVVAKHLAALHWSRTLRMGAECRVSLGTHIWLVAGPGWAWGCYGIPALGM